MVPPFKAPRRDTLQYTMATMHASRSNQRKPPHIRNKETGSRAGRGKQPPRQANGKASSRNGNGNHRLKPKVSKMSRKVLDALNAIRVKKDKHYELVRAHELL